MTLRSLLRPTPRARRVLAGQVPVRMMFDDRMMDGVIRMGDMAGLVEIKMYTGPYTRTDHQELRADWAAVSDDLLIALERFAELQGAAVAERPRLRPDRLARCLNA